MIRRLLRLALALLLAGPALAQTSVTIKDGNGNPVAVRAPNADGRAAAASSAPVVMSTEDAATATAAKTDLDTLAGRLGVLNGDGGTQVHLTNGPSGYALETGGNLGTIAAELGATTTPAAGTVNAQLLTAVTRLTSIVTALQGTLLDGGLVVSGNQSYTVGATQQLNLTPTGRLKVGLSSASNIAPAALPATTLEADMAACTYRAATTWTVGWTGALGCGSDGSLLIGGSSGTALPQAASTAKNLIVGGAVADGSTPQTYSEVVAGIDAAGLKRTVSTDATGALVPPQAPSAAITQTVTAVAATTSTTIAAASATAIAVEIQCDGTAPVAIDRKGGTLTSLAAAPLVLPQTAYQLYVMPIATTSAITAYTATAQTCRVTQYARQ